MGRILLLFLSLQISAFADDVSDFDALWRGYRSEIASARIDYTVARMQTEPSSLDEFKQRLESVDLTQSEGIFERFAQEFSKNWDGERKVWDDQQLVVDGSHLKSVGEHFTHLQVRKLHLVFDHLAGCVTGYNRGECPYGVIEVDSFRDAPNQTYVENQVPIQELDEWWLLETKGGRLYIDPNDGLPREHVVLMTNSDLPYRFRKYTQHTVYPGGMIMPTVRVEATCNEDGVNHVELRVIRDAEFNTEILESEFVIGLKQGSNWFDSRSYFSGGQVREPVRDAIEYYEVVDPPDEPLKKLSDEAPQIASSFPFTWHGFLLLLNGLALIALGVHFWHRQPSS